MIPQRLAPVAFGLLLSGMMSLVVSGVSTVRVVGFASDVVTLWMTSWVYSWAVAFPTVLVVAPFVRGIVARLARA